MPGRLDVAGDRIAIAGGSRLEPRWLELSAAELAAVRIARRTAERIGGRSTLILELRDGRTLSVADFAQVGVLRELSERLAAAIAY